MPNDIIYILKDEIDTEELKYSLRSVQANFPHRLVWFIGGQPKGLKPDVILRHHQTGADKWSMIRSSMLAAVKDADLSEEFFLFNDDFFIMKPVSGRFINYINGTLEDRLDELRRDVHPWLNPYGRTVLKAQQELRAQGFTELNFELHMPMLFEKRLVAEALKKCSSPQMRSVYGNVTGTPWRQHQDVKIYDLETVPDDPDYLSTNDEIFNNGKVGEYIRRSFPTPSRFEV